MSDFEKKGAWFTTKLIGDTKIHIHEDELDDYLRAEVRLGIKLIIFSIIGFIALYFIHIHGDNKNKPVKQNNVEDVRTTPNNKQYQRTTPRSGPKTTPNPW